MSIIFLKLQVRVVSFLDPVLRNTGALSSNRNRSKMIDTRARCDFFSRFQSTYIVFVRLFDRSPETRCSIQFIERRDADARNYLRDSVRNSDVIFPSCTQFPVWLERANNICFVTLEDPAPTNVTHFSYDRILFKKINDSRLTRWATARLQICFVRWPQYRRCSYQK